MDADHLPVATKYNGLPSLVACRGYKYVQDVNFVVHPIMSESVIRIANCVGGDCFHKFDKEGHPILIDRTVSIFFSFYIVISTNSLSSFRVIITLKRWEIM